MTLYIITQRAKKVKRFACKYFVDFGKNAKEKLGKVLSKALKTLENAQKRKSLRAKRYDCLLFFVGCAIMLFDGYSTVI